MLSNVLWKRRRWLGRHEGNMVKEWVNGCVVLGREATQSYHREREQGRSGEAQDSRNSKRRGRDTRRPHDGAQRNGSQTSLRAAQRGREARTAGCCGEATGRAGVVGTGRWLSASAALHQDRMVCRYRGAGTRLRREVEGRTGGVAHSSHPHT